ncbi:hypothetical protein [Occallatibacter riparius]|uniref:Secreted protein n=1 Tax=Occallatibacter riparius TaxID=1002689 RepID=A0A9J7BUT2_9BACT|nr:hypothetical protein [Occallatibacter riparius]UWZ86635.1 hypothetical protein MOP44_11975 [Occallatibacter riparius]
MVFAFLALSLASPPISAATPSFTITGTDVKISGQGTASTTFTVKSTNGFAGKVGAYCLGPNPNLLPDYVLAQCNHPTQNVMVPSGGSVTGTIEFYPPWTAQPGPTSAMQAKSQSSRHPSSPLMAGAFLGFGLLGLRLRRYRLSTLTAISVAPALWLSTGLTGCGGNPGLAMTPGKYTYTLHAATPPDVRPAISTTANINVTVNCDSCP